VRGVVLEKDCKPRCLVLDAEELIADDGANCEAQGDVCKWACNGTCADENNPGITEIGATYIDTEARDVDEIATSVELINVFFSGFFPDAHLGNFFKSPVFFYVRILCSCAFVCFMCHFYCIPCRLCVAVNGVTNKKNNN